MPRTKATPITATHKTTYLEAIADGQPRSQAARLAHPDLTATRFRRYADRDPAFKDAVQAAEREGNGNRADRINDELQLRAFNPSTAGSARLLELLAATYSPDFHWLRTKGQPELTGDEEPLLPMVNTELLTGPQLERLASLRDEMVVLIEMGQGKRPNPDLEPRELPPGDPSTNGRP